MMAIQLISKPPTRIELPSLSHCHHHRRSPFVLNTTKLSICCNKTAAPLTFPTPDRGFVEQLLINKYGLTEESRAKVFKKCDNLIYSTTIHNVEQALHLLRDHGLTLPQIRKLVMYNSRFFLLNPNKNINAKLNFLKTFMKEKDMAKLVSTNPRFFNLSIENMLKPKVSFLQTFGYEGEDLSLLLVTVPSLISFSEENILRLFKQAKTFGYTKGSPMFALALRAISSVSEDLLEQKLQHLCSLGFSEEQVMLLCRRLPKLMATSKKKVKRIVDFLVNSAGLSLHDFVKYPDLLTYSLEVRLIPRYRVVESLKSMAVLKNPPTFPQVVRLTEKCFFEKYVKPYAESTFLQDTYRGFNSLLNRERDLS